MNEKESGEEIVAGVEHPMRQSGITDDRKIFDNSRLLPG